MRYALIDLGSNSARMSLTEIRDGKAVLLSKHRVMTRLSQGMGPEKFLQPEPVRRTLAVLKKFSALAKSQDAAVIAAATAAVRTAANRAEFCQKTEEETGIRLHVLSGRQEALLDFEGVLSQLPDLHSFLITDTGGGSTELILVKGQKLREKVSLPFGAVNLRERFPGLPEPEALEACQSLLLENIENISFLKEAQGLPLAGLGGSLAALGAAAFPDCSNHDALHGRELPADRLLRLYNKLAALTPEARIAQGIEPGRADTVCFGLLPVCLLTQKLNSPKLIFSSAGLREGILWEILNQPGNFSPENWELL